MSLETYLGKHVSPIDQYGRWGIVERVNGEYVIRFDDGETISFVPDQTVLAEVCGICGRMHYPLWSAENSLWNATMRDENGNEGIGMACLCCFVEKANSTGNYMHFHVEADKWGDD